MTAGSMSRALLALLCTTVYMYRHTYVHTRLPRTYTMSCRPVEGGPACLAMAGQVFEKVGSQNLYEIDVFWSRISNPDEE